MRRTIFTSLLALVVIGARGAHSLATEIIFTLNSASTTLTASGTTTISNVTFKPQQTGSNIASATGNLLVDVTSPTSPTAVTFLPGKGYQSVSNTKNGANFQPSGTPANAAFNVLYGGLFNVGQLAVRDTTYDFSSAASAVAGNGAFTPQNLVATALTGHVDDNVSGSLETNDITGTVAPVGSSSGTITYSNGVLSLTLNGTASNTQAVDTSGNTATTTVLAHLVATANFSPANLATLTSVASPVSVLGGTSTVGGVAAQFSPGTSTGGTFSAQVIPLAGLPYQSLSGLSAFGISSLSQNAQVWNLEYSGGTYSGPITVTLHYDPSLLTPDLQAHPENIHIAHFNSLSQQWEILPNVGAVDTVHDTITVMTTSLSPLMPVSVPEPSSAVLGVTAICGAAALAWVRKRRSQRT